MIRTLIPSQLLAAVAAVAVTMVWPAMVAAIGWDGDDFLIAGITSDSIGVFDSDLSFKGNVDANFDGVTGLDFNAAGNLVAVGQNQQVRVYHRSGTMIADFTNADIGSPFDIKVGPAALGGNYYVGTSDVRGGTGLQEFSPAGATLRQFDDGDYESVAVLPDDVVWGGGSLSLGGTRAFDIATSNLIDTLPREPVVTMSYSSSTDTVLVGQNNSSGIAEVQRNGDFVRSFTADSFLVRGLTRGPGDDVFATSQFDNNVYRWNADGTFVNSTNLGSSIDRPRNIVWAGNTIPEPTASAMLFSSGVMLLGWHAVTQRQRRFVRG